MYATNLYHYGIKPVKEFELKPTGRQKSFYGKASVVIDNEGTVYLRSYETIVACIEGGIFKRMWDGWSSTTAKHIDSFRNLYGLPGVGKKEWEGMEVYYD